MWIYIDVQRQDESDLGAKRSHVGWNLLFPGPSLLAATGIFYVVDDKMEAAS